MSVCHLWSGLKYLNNSWLPSIKFDSDIYATQRLNCNNFDDPISLHVLLPLG